MKQTLLIAILVILSFGPSLTQNIQFNDVNFKNALFANGVDTNMDDEISIQEAANVVSLDISNSPVNDMTEIKYFTNLKDLDCSENQLTTLDVSGLANLEDLRCWGNQLTTLDVSGLAKLEVLRCWDNQLTTLEVSDLTNLQRLDCSINQLTTLDVSGLTKLEILFCWNNQLTTLDVSGLANLEVVYCDNNNLTMIDLRGIKLKSFDASPNPLQCVVIDADGKPFNDEGLLASLYTTEPCLATFETLTHLVENSDAVDYQRTILLTALRSVETLCSLGSKEAAILMLWTMSGTVHLWQQWGAIATELALEIREAISLLTDGIRSGEVDCSPDDDLWDWFLDEPTHVEPGFQERTFTDPTEPTLRLYPNPTPGMVNLSRPAQDVHVYNLIGQHLLQARDVDRLDLSAYEPGVYVIRIGSGRDGTVHRVVRQ